MTTIADMTLEELKRLITDTVAETVDARLARLFGKFEIDEDEIFPEEELDTRTWEEVKQDIERHRWTPPPGTPSLSQMIREDRDSR